MKELHQTLLNAIEDACKERKQPPEVAARIIAWVEAAATSQMPIEEKFQRLGDIRETIKLKEQS